MLSGFPATLGLVELGDAVLIGPDDERLVDESVGDDGPDGEVGFDGSGRLGELG